MSGWGQVLNTDPDYVLDISRPPRRTHSPHATSRRNHGLPRSRSYIPGTTTAQHTWAPNNLTVPLAERGITVDHVTIYRWVQRFTPLLIDAARPCQHAAGDRWFVDETYGKVAGRWVYLYRAIDQFGQVIDVLVSEKRDLAATRRFFTRALGQAPRPAEVTTDRAQAYPRALDELLPATCHVMEKYANNPIESDHSRLKSRLRPMRASNSSAARG